jgi:hypothetical protein
LGAKATNKQRRYVLSGRKVYTGALLAPKKRNSPPKRATVNILFCAGGAPYQRFCAMATKGGDAQRRYHYHRHYLRQHHRHLA